MKSKRCAGYIIVLFIMLSMSIAVQAEVYDGDGWLKVGGVDILDSEYKNQIPEGMSYDVTTNTLTLDNCTYQLKSGENNFIDYNGREDLNIVFKGENKVIGRIDEETGSLSWWAFYSSGENLNFSGGGSLDIEKFNEVAGFGINTIQGNINISNVTLTSSSADFFTDANININKSAIKLDRKEGNELSGITTHSNLYIRESVIDITNFEYPFSFGSCDIAGEYIYVGTTSLEYAMSLDSFFSQDPFNHLYYPTELYIGKRVLITNIKQNLGYRYDLKKVYSKYGEITKLPEYGIAGKTIAVSVKPYTGYAFDYLLVNDKKVYAKTFTMPSANTTVKAVFKKAGVKKPKAASIKTLKNKKGKKAVLTWKKISGVSGYQIVYAKNAGFTKGKKSVKVGAKATSKTFKKLTKKKTYYFKIRTYKGSSYSSWSKAKHIKIKK